MAFTFAHPAIVLPLYGKHSKYIDFTALVLGTMAPDFEYFIRFRPFQTVGHTFPGQLYLNLPIALLLAYIFHYLMKEPMIRNLPRPFCGRYHYLTERKWGIHSFGDLSAFCLSMLFGAISHLAWDGFTHATGWFVERIDLLYSKISLAGLEFPVYKALQHGTTLLGLAAIAVFMILLQNEDEEKSGSVSASGKCIFWGGAFAVGICVIALRVLLAGNMALGEAIVSSVDGALIGLFLVSFVFRNRNGVN